MMLVHLNRVIPTIINITTVCALIKVMTPIPDSFQPNLTEFHFIQLNFSSEYILYDVILARRVQILSKGLTNKWLIGK